jgi:hypothetical protein
MNSINEEQFFAQYPRYKNLDELKKADILIMPLYKGRSFAGDQRAFCSLAFGSKLNCLYYSGEINNIFFYPEPTDSPRDLIINFGTVVITSLAGLNEIYTFFKKRTEGHRFRVKHVIVIKGHYSEVDEFQGSVDEYTAVYQEMRSAFEK